MRVKMENENYRPKIVTKPGFKVIGLSIVCNDKGPNDNIGPTWNKFVSRVQEIKHKINEEVLYSIMFCGLKEESDPQSLVEYPDFIYIVAVEVDSFNDMPEDMVKKAIPDALYAVFTCKDEDMDKGFAYAYAEWLPQSGYMRNDNGVDFEYYDKNYKTEPYEVSIYIPIKKI